MTNHRKSSVTALSIALSLALSAAAPALSLADSPADGATVPFTYVDNRMMIKCMLDGKGPFLMVLDTGTPDITLAPETAKQIGVAVRENGTAYGAGDKQVAAGSAKLATLSIGSLSFKHLDASVIDLTEIRTKLGFKHLDGIIGYPVLKRFATFVDVDTGTITFSSATPSLPSNATTTTFKGQTPVIAATIGGVATTVIVDTGDRSSLTLFGPFAKAKGFYGRYPSKSNIVTGYGLGGPVYGDIFTLPSLNVLDTHLRGIVTRASLQTGGAFTSSDQGGSVGDGVLKRFNIVYDYPRGRIFAWPSKYFNAPDVFVPPPGPR
jgi:hypothetical protein